MFLVKIHITPKPSILDPQGQAVELALHRLGYKEVNNLRVGRYIEITLKDITREEAKLKVENYCEKLLANPVTENYSYQIEDNQ